ncbi:Rne/Rng family ribonuclease [Lichenicola cladoniae]|uniref:Rne/Rng family ribonuclease n=1 Tax=Lichenicola cladoniae TaxID=1484109 RepID=UPI001EF7067A|nr:ribonuclease E/G [Lichenicola cladoniae]
MTKRMLIDTTHAEETRVVVLDGNRLEDYDVETSAKKQIKGNIYLAKIVRIEPSLQAAFVEYGGNRHGFLAFSEIHPDYYQIPVADRERLIALQEEEARADEARADREDEADDDSGDDTTDHAPSGNRRSSVDPFADQAETFEPSSDQPDDESEFGPEPDGTIALAVQVETVYADADTHAEHAGASESGASESGASESGNAEDGTNDAPARVSNRSAHDRQPRPEQSDEPAPETVGGENGGDDDGRAQRRTARFLRQYKIQEVMRRRQILLIQVVKEERGNKGAALTTYVSLAGRFCVLMPNSLRGGGVSRKITSAADRKRLKDITTELEIPRGMAMIVRTAGAQRPKPEIRRDCEYLLRTWDDIRETTLESSAPCLVYEEASLIKRAIRDVYTKDIEEIVVDGEPGWKGAREFMRTLMPANANKVNLWRDESQPLFSHYQVEHHLDAMLQPTVQLRSGGYLVINQTEALVAIDVNSGRSTRERSIEETALRTNMEAADEVARQLRLRDLAGLIVIDFIDMEARRNNAMVERRLKDALRNDRARIQVGSISHFGLMEMSRQRLRPSLAESSFVTCAHCGGSGFMRGTESSALHVLRAIEEEAGKRKSAEIRVRVAASVAFYVLNHKRAWLQEIETRHHLTVHLLADDSLIPPALEIDKIGTYVGPQLAAPVERPAPAPVQATRIPIAAAPPPVMAETEEGWDDEPVQAQKPVVARVADQAQPALPDAAASSEGPVAADGEDEHRRKRRRRRRRGGRREDGSVMPEGAAQPELGGSDEDEMPGETADAVAPTLLPGETLASPSVFEASAADVAPVDATRAAEPGQDPGQRGRRRRGGGRNRPRPDGSDADAGPADRQDAQGQAPRPYNGPTPADPFAGSYDIFELMERDADEGVALVPNPSASAASYAPSSPIRSQPIAETTPEPTPAPAPAEPAQEAAVPVPEPVVDAIGEVEPVVAPTLDLGPDVAADAKAPATPKVRKPRASRAKKAAPVEAVTPDATDPAVELAAEPEAPQVAIAPEPAPETSVAAPEPAPAADAVSVADPSIVQAKIISSDAPAAKPRSGWWKR